MTQEKITAILNEIAFKTSRSGGPGGQHANKVETKVTLIWDVANSKCLTSPEKETVLRKLSNYVTKDGVLMINQQTERSQIGNKEKVVQRLKRLLKQAFRKQKKRKPTKPSAESKRRRLEWKRRRSDIKKSRQKPTL